MTATYIHNNNIIFLGNINIAQIEAYGHPITAKGTCYLDWLNRHHQLWVLYRITAIIWYRGNLYIDQNKLDPEFLWLAHRYRIHSKI